jgi:hypothetical protein
MTQRRNSNWETNCIQLEHSRWVRASVLFQIKRSSYPPASGGLHASTTWSSEMGTLCTPIPFTAIYNASAIIEKQSIDCL